MKVENWGDIHCHECKRELIEVREFDAKKLRQGEALFRHPQNSIGSVEYGWPKCAVEGRLIVVKTPTLDAEVMDESEGS